MTLGNSNPNLNKIYIRMSLTPWLVKEKCKSARILNQIHHLSKLSTVETKHFSLSFLLICTNIENNRSTWLLDTPRTKVFFITFLKGWLIFMVLSCNKAGQKIFNSSPLWVHQKRLLKSISLKLVHRIPRLSWWSILKKLPIALIESRSWLDVKWSVHFLKLKTSKFFSISLSRKSFLCSLRLRMI